MDLSNADAPPADAASALRLIEEQQARAARQLNPDPRLFHWPWGVAWLVGFGLLFLRFGPDGRVFVDLPRWLPLTVLFVLLALAGTISSVAGARAYGQVSGESSRRGGWYGSAWFLGYASLMAVNLKVAGLLPEDLQGLLWSATAVGLTGVLHLAGGAIWLDRDMFLLGAWILVLNIAGTLAGAGWHSLVIAIGGGGGLLVTGTVARLRRS
ncbi:hypothetical protein GCM10027290_53440 [Micromonospora sonneratiae]|uniref:Transporter n=1 Tax=Micromonospora sonneratiae TaxID=1184706 RepID=A0ABW3YDF7_9ACTN